jgi:glycosyltransferase involved in cell wall biosynthesis
MTSFAPLLSIVTPTRGHLTALWCDALAAIRGDVEFVMVFPPGVEILAPADARVRAFASPLRGEVMQRTVGLLNARGRYVLALDDDDFAHPEIAALAADYFARFPDSWVLRPTAEYVAHTDVEKITRPWTPIPNSAELEICAAPSAHEFCLTEIPIAPLPIPFRWQHLLVPTTPRRDMRGIHFENFNNRVWRRAMVQPALAALAEKFTLWGAFKFIPAFSLDRLLGLYIQAYYFEPHKTIGHWLGGPALLRRTYRPASEKEFRLLGPADALLVRSFPRYGYFWNLFFFKLYQETAAALRQLFTR